MSFRGSGPARRDRARERRAGDRPSPVSKPRGAPSSSGRNPRVYVHNLDWSVEWQDLKDHFKAVGNVVYAEVHKEPDGRSKGCGIVEFSTPVEAERAIASLNDSIIKGRTILVREDREAREAREDDGGRRGGGGGGGRYGDALASHPGPFKVIFKNLPWVMTWGELKDMCRLAGTPLRANVLTSSDGKSKGIGICEFATRDEAETAIDKLNLRVVDGHTIEVHLDRDLLRRHGDAAPGRGGAGRRGSRSSSDSRRRGGGGSGGGERHAEDALGAAEASGTRRVYVGNLSWSTSWQDLKDHFKPIGEVVYADVMRGPDKRSKGCGIVEFKEAGDAQEAIARMNDTDLDGRKIFVREDREDKEVGGGGGSGGGGGGGGARRGGRRDSRDDGGHGDGVVGTKIFIGNLPFTATWQTVKDRLRVHGEVIRVEIPQESSGRSRGFAIAEVASPESAADIIRELHDSDFEGRRLIVREDRED